MMKKELTPIECFLQGVVREGGEHKSLLLTKIKSISYLYEEPFKYREICMKEKNTSSEVRVIEWLLPEKRNQWLAFYFIKTAF